MNIDYVKKLIVELGFVPQDGTSGVFVKRYAAHNNYPIFVDFDRQKIEYVHQSVQTDKRIRLGDLTTSNLEKPENFVVLECVDRLLSKGYRPERLELEKKYPLGRNLKGKLDILVYSENDDAPFLMIECKTWGSEFEKESAKTLKDGGQIFSYYQQDRAAKFLCLYASRLDKKKIEYRNNIVLVEDSWRDLSSAKDIHDYWNKNFKDNGIFEAYATPYDIKPKALTYGMLKNLKEEDSGKIYNQIMEILRHNAISDKPNAFNKLLNLFVCKIIDENKNPTDELEFQWLETDTDESLQMRLNDLYKDGMWRFLEIRIIDHSEEDVAKALEGIDNPTQRRQLMDMFRDARLKKSPNFAFVEVLDEKTFKLNAKIVREIVELLQVYKFRYEQKHEFLGSFFELLLNTSMKQEAGQFFTPVPITRFIISSLPLKEFVQSKIDNRERNVLPVVMDYACGSGHFLTEYMDQMQRVIDNKIDVSVALPDVRNKIESWRGLTKFLWAKDSVYGIDLDNRLVKTTKVSAFFNGDGEANIIWANGLDNFEKTEEYRDILRQTQPYDRKNNGQFDILISNPPYSVEAFKSTLKYGEETFELYNNITDNSSEIECLFIERMKQLLKVGGWAGVILPSSILSNGGIHSRAREILFKYFKVKAIVELGSGTFMKTGTNTVVLFLERRSDNDFVSIEKAINVFMSTLKDVTVLGIENAFSKYVANVYDNLAFNDYISFISGKASIAMQKHELYSDCQKSFSNDIYAKAIALEKEKMLYFLLTYAQNIVLVKTGQKQEEKNFLGYEFSERRGHEGIKRLFGGTKLFDENGDLLNPQKANSYIYNAYLGKTLSVDESLTRNVSYGQMSSLINYGTSKFDKVVNLGKRQKKLESQHPLVSLGAICDIKIGGTPSRDIPEYFMGNNLWVSVSELNGGVINDTKEKITDEAIQKSNVKLIPRGTTLLSFKLSIGKLAVAGRDLYTNEAIAALIPRDRLQLLDAYLFAIFDSGMIDLDSLKGDNAFGKSLNSEQLNTKVFIPLPSLDVQRKIVAEVETLESDIAQLGLSVMECNRSIEARFMELFGDPATNPKGWVIKKLSDIIVHVNNGMSRRGKDANGNIVLRLVELQDGFIDYTNTNRIQLSDEEKQRYLLADGDFLFARVNGNPENVGRCAVFNDIGEPVYHNDHIIRVRFDQEIINGVFASKLLNGPYVKSQIRAKVNTTAGQFTVNQGGLGSVRIPLPPLSLQNDFMDYVHKSETEKNKIQQQLDELLQRKKDLLKKYL